MPTTTLWSLFVFGFYSTLNFWRWFLISAFWLVRFTVVVKIWIIDFQSAKRIIDYLLSWSTDFFLFALVAVVVLVVAGLGFLSVMTSSTLQSMDLALVGSDFLAPSTLARFALLGCSSFSVSANLPASIHCNMAHTNRTTVDKLQYTWWMGQLAFTTGFNSGFGWGFNGSANESTVIKDKTLWRDYGITYSNLLLVTPPGLLWCCIKRWTRRFCCCCCRAGRDKLLFGCTVDRFNRDGGGGGRLLLLLLLL